MTMKVSVHELQSFNSFGFNTCFRLRRLGRAVFVVVFDSKSTLRPTSIISSRHLVASIVTLPVFVKNWEALRGIPIIRSSY